MQTCEKNQYMRIFCLGKNQHKNASKCRKLALNCVKRLKLALKRPFWPRNSTVWEKISTITIITITVFRIPVAMPMSGCGKYSCRSKESCMHPSRKKLMKPNHNLPDQEYYTCCSPDRWSDGFTPQKVKR